MGGFSRDGSEMVGKNEDYVQNICCVVRRCVVVTAWIREQMTYGHPEGDLLCVKVGGCSLIWGVAPQRDFN